MKSYTGYQNKRRPILTSVTIAENKNYILLLFSLIKE